MAKDYLAKMEWSDRIEREDDHVHSMRRIGRIVGPSSYWRPFGRKEKDILNFDLTKILAENSMDKYNPTGVFYDEYGMAGQIISGTKRSTIISGSGLLDVVSESYNNMHGSKYIPEPMYFSKTYNKNNDAKYNKNYGQNFTTVYRPETLFPELLTNPDQLRYFPGEQISNFIFNNYVIGSPANPEIKTSNDGKFVNGMFFYECIFNRCTLHLSHSSMLNSHFVNCDINIYLSYDTIHKLFSIPIPSNFLSIFSGSTFNNCNINILNEYPPHRNRSFSPWHEKIEKSNYGLFISSSGFRNSKIYCDESIKDLTFSYCTMNNTILDVEKPNFTNNTKFTESDIDTFFLFTRDQINEIIDYSFEPTE